MQRDDMSVVQAVDCCMLVCGSERTRPTCQHVKVHDLVVPVLDVFQLLVEHCRLTWNCRLLTL